MHWSTWTLFFKTFSHVVHKKIGIFSCPVWQLKVIYSLFILHQSEIQTIYVQICFRNSIQLRYQFSDVWVFRYSIFIWVSKWEEKSICEIKFSTLKENWTLGIRGKSDQKMIYNSWAWIVSSIVEFWSKLIINMHHFIPLFKIMDPVFSSVCSHWKCKISDKFFIIGLRFIFSKVD